MWGGAASLTHGHQLVESATQSLGPGLLPLPEQLRGRLWEEVLVSRAGSKEQASREYLQRGTFRPDHGTARLVQGWLAEQEAECLMLATWRGEAGDLEQLVPRLLTRMFGGERDLELLYWLQPLLPLLDQDLELEDMLPELGWRLEVVARWCRPEDAQVHHVVDQVYRHLGERDPEYLQHLEQVAGRGRRARVGRLRAGLLGLGEPGERMAKVLREAEGWATEGTMIEVMQGGGKVLVRKWIAEVTKLSSSCNYYTVQGFVSVLPRSGLTYLWDVLFLHRWSPDLLEAAALALLLLLRPYIMRLTSAPGLLQAMLQVQGHGGKIAVRE